MKSKIGVLYRCFMLDECLENKYTELLFDRSVDEDVIEKFALDKLGTPSGHLEKYGEDIVELNRFNQLYVTNLFISRGSEKPPLILCTALRMSQQELDKIVEALRWITTDDVSNLTSLGNAGFLRITDHKAPPKPERKQLTYLETRLLSAVNKHTFVDKKSLLSAIKGGSARDQDYKKECLNDLIFTGLLEFDVNGVRITKEGSEALREIDIPLDLDSDSNKDPFATVKVKEYPESGIVGLTPTAEAIMKVIRVEQRLSKSQLMNVLNRQGVYNIYGCIGRAVDILVRNGLLSANSNFKAMAGGDVLSINEDAALLKNRKTLIDKFIAEDATLLTARIMPGYNTGKADEKIVWVESLIKAVNDIGVEMSPQQARAVLDHKTPHLELKRFLNESR